MNETRELNCLKKETQTHRYSLLAGIVMCGLGLIMFMNFSLTDFLMSGFVEKGTLAATQIPAQESVSRVMHVDETNKPMTLLLSHQDSPVTFNVKIENLQGITVYDKNVVKPTVTFVPDLSGDYLVSIKNLSSKDTIVSVSYGYLRTSENVFLFSVLWVLFIIGGNYIIIHTYFTGTKNQSRFTR